MAQKKRILVGISGGVDSAVAAALLKTQGHEVIGAYLDILPAKLRKLPRTGGPCCSITTAEKAQEICSALEIPFYPIDVREIYESEVFDELMTGALIGRMPHPCVLCTQRVKIIGLLAKAHQLKCDSVATGHYAKVIQNPDRTDYSLFKAVDTESDQSFYLFGLRQDHLAKVITPLGDLLKTKVRKMAQTFELPCEDQPRTHKACWVGDDSFHNYIKESVPDRYRPAGPLVSKDGHVLGRHTGTYQHALGDNEGLTTSGRPEWVNWVPIGYDLNVSGLIMGPPEDLMKTGFVVQNCNWIGELDFSKGVHARARLRSDHPEAACTITLLNGNGVRVDFDEAQLLVAPGQPVVFYHEDLVLGGGWIEALVDPVKTTLKRRSSTGYT